LAGLFSSTNKKGDKKDSKSGSRVDIPLGDLSKASNQDISNIFDLLKRLDKLESELVLSLLHLHLVVKSTFSKITA
jgi:hypothetical protein